MGLLSLERNVKLDGGMFRIGMGGTELGISWDLGFERWTWIDAMSFAPYTDIAFH
jgi:hypothetical protein